MRAAGSGSQALTLQQLEQLAEDLLDFSGTSDLQAWFDDHPAG